MFDGSFKIYVEPRNKHENPNDMEMGRAGPGNEPYSLEMFSKEVENVKEDMANVEKLYMKLQESHEEMKNAESAKTMKELRVRMNTDLEYIIKLAKQINRKHDGLVRGNAAQRRVAGSGAGSSDEQARTSMISEVGENLKHMMRKFQGLRAQMETEHRQIIETRYFTMTREKATAEAIDNLIANEVVAESPLHHAMQEHGRAPVLDMVAEIQERRDTMREIRKNMMGLHQILLGITSPVVPADGNGGGARGPPSPMETHAAAAAVPQVMAAPKAGTGQLNDYERETRKQAYIAIAVALVVIVVVIVPLLMVENHLESNTDV